MEIRTAAACVRRLRHTGSVGLVDEQLSLPAVGLLVALATAQDSEAVERAWARAGSRRDELVGELEARGYLRRVAGEVWLVSDDPADLLSVEELISPGARDREVVRWGVALVKEAMAAAAGEKEHPGPSRAKEGERAASAEPAGAGRAHLEATGLFAGEFGIHRDKEGHPALGERADPPAPCVICGRESESVFEGVVVHVPCYWVSTRATRTRAAGTPLPISSSDEGGPGGG